ncbi:hypothetical protein WAJ73_23275, partial [Acinetobacter baumannii]
ITGSVTTGQGRKPFVSFAYTGPAEIDYLLRRENQGHRPQDRSRTYIRGTSEEKQRPHKSGNIEK